MAYKITRNKLRRDAVCRRMREGKEAKRLAMAAKLGPRAARYVPPALRRVVVVIDYDFEPVIDVYRLGKAHRIDSYRISKNGEDAGHAGWANFCKRLSVHYPRIISSLSLE